MMCLSSIYDHCLLSSHKYHVLRICILDFTLVNPFLTLVRLIGEKIIIQLYSISFIISFSKIIEGALNSALVSSPVSKCVCHTLTQRYSLYVIYSYHPL